MNDIVHVIFSREAFLRYGKEHVDVKKKGRFLGEERYRNGWGPIGNDAMFVLWELANIYVG